MEISQEGKEFFSWNKKHFSSFLKIFHSSKQKKSRKEELDFYQIVFVFRIAENFFE